MNHLESLVKTQKPIHEVWGGAGDSAFLPSSQGKLMLLRVYGPHFEQEGFRRSLVPSALDSTVLVSTSFLSSGPPPAFSTPVSTRNKTRETALALEHATSNPDLRKVVAVCHIFVGLLITGTSVNKQGRQPRDYL